MTPDRSREDAPPEEAVGARDMSQAGDAQAEPQTALTETDASVPSADVVWVRISPSQVMRAVVIALLSAAVVLGALFLIWQVRTFVGWFVIALFLAAVLNPAVNWLQRRHRLIKRPIAIALTYLALVVALLFIVAIFLPLLVDQIQGLVKFVTTVANAPQGPTKYLEGLAKQNGLGSVFERFSDQLGNVSGQLRNSASNLLLSTGNIIVSAAGFVAALATILTLTFFLILGSERYLDAGVGLFAEAHRPLVRRLTQSAGAVTGYVTGNTV